jgi:hypothetical protein
MLDRSRRTRMTRRQFNALTGAAGIALAMPNIARAAGEDSAAIIKGKKSGLIIHNAKLGVMETPLTELRKYAITRTKARRPGMRARRLRLPSWSTTGTCASMAWSNGREM